MFCVCECCGLKCTRSLFHFHFFFFKSNSDLGGSLTSPVDVVHILRFSPRGEATSFTWLVWLCVCLWVCVCVSVMWTTNWTEPGTHSTKKKVAGSLSCFTRPSPLNRSEVMISPVQRYRYGKYSLSLSISLSFSLFCLLLGSWLRRFDLDKDGFSN